jgi:hypothetical protein
MSIFNLIPRKMDGSAVYGYERNGLYLANRAIHELFALKGSLSGDSIIRFEPDFDFKLINFRAYSGNNVVKLSLYENQSSTDYFEYYNLNLTVNAWNKLTTFSDNYHKKGTIIELQLDESNGNPSPFLVLIQQCNFIDFPSL